MSWRLTHDVEVFAAQVSDLLSADPVEHTVPLTVIESVRGGMRWSDLEMLFGWFDEGGIVRGAVLMTPPYELLLVVVPLDTVAELAGALRRRRARVPGAQGDIATVTRFAEAFTAGTSVRAATAMRMRLYALSDLRSPSGVPGRARPATQNDVDRVVAWMRAFHGEVDVPAADLESTVRAQIADGRLWLWHDLAGTAVALAGRSGTVARMARVGPVYTPPEHRRRGYGAAVTAAVTADALRAGADRVVLFTDLDNPISNSIYQRIGYRPVSDRRVVRFSA
ncbi:MAG: GNAT family N-acetyltransferase [Dactylosporangium sp.]|nr:GNAT family N-acetyltransferase [Dactylosporangium sp.]NNJ60509.1 GNAT family N-acetyltransferase [Dactylosporangium sp.]